MLGKNGVGNQVSVWKWLSVEICHHQSRHFVTAHIFCSIGQKGRFPTPKAATGRTMAAVKGDYNLTAKIKFNLCVPYQKVA